MESEASPNSPAVSEVLSIVGDLAMPLERRAVVERVGRVAAESIGADLGFVGLPDGADHLRLDSFHATRTSSLGKLRVARGKGLGGKVLATGVPCAVEEYVASDSITHEYDAEIAEEGLTGLLCVPWDLGGDLTGVTYVSDRTPRAYSDIMIERVMTAVESAKVALSIADRSVALTEAAIEADRAQTKMVLDECVGDSLNHILAIAQKIASDPLSSPELVVQASDLISNASAATSALSGVVFGASVPSPKSVPDFLLSERELEVVQLAAKGLSNPEIAAELFLARGTVKAYMETVLRKLEARNRVEAVMIAARSGLLDEL